MKWDVVRALGYPRPQVDTSLHDQNNFPRERPSGDPPKVENSPLHTLCKVPPSFCPEAADPYTARIVHLDHAYLSQVKWMSIQQRWTVRYTLVTPYEQETPGRPTERPKTLRGHLAAHSLHCVVFIISHSESKMCTRVVFVRGLVSFNSLAGLPTLTNVSNTGSWPEVKHTPLTQAPHTCATQSTW